VLGRVIHSHARLRGNAVTRVLDLMVWVGFAVPKKVAEQATLFGHVAFYQAAA
jgi:hypothetical protein